MRIDRLAAGYQYAQRRTDSGAARLRGSLTESWIRMLIAAAVATISWVLPTRARSFFRVCFTSTTMRPADVRAWTIVAP